MTLRFRPGTYYRMPVTFGPTPGPRMIPADKRKAFSYSMRRTMARVSCLGEPRQLERLLPPGFALRGEPLVTIEFQHLSEVAWLAGRGYAVCGVKFPVTCHGASESVDGDFLAVLWENLADPIISGREELGFAKVYCEIPEPAVLGGTHTYGCSWQGFPFLSMAIEDLRDDDGASTAGTDTSQGTLHYKYIPKTGHPGEADVSYPTLTPIENPSFKVLARKAGTGSVVFKRARWEDLPTMHHIVNALARLRLGEVRSASITWAEGGKDLSDQRIVR